MHHDVMKPDLPLNQDTLELTQRRVGSTLARQGGDRYHGGNIRQDISERRVEDQAIDRLPEILPPEKSRDYEQ